MRASTVAQRYARALLDIGIERGTFGALGEELSSFVELFAAPELKELFRNPKFNAEARKRVLNELVEGVSPICKNFLSLLVDRNRIRFLPEITEAYHALADDHAGRVRARITTAKALTPEQSLRLGSALSSKVGREVDLDQQVDPEILGGLIARVGDRIYDGSLRAQLNTLKNQLKTSR